MKNILKIEPNESSFSFKWLIPLGMAVAAIVLVMTINITNNPTAPKIENIVISNADNQIHNIDISLLVNNIDSGLINGIDQEQQAIVEDIKYFKSLLVL